jgi:hypothetical protein
MENAQELKSCPYDGSEKVFLIKCKGKLKVVCSSCGHSGVTVEIENAGGYEKAEALLSRLWNRQASEPNYFEALRGTRANIIHSVGCAIPISI